MLWNGNTSHLLYQLCTHHFIDIWAYKNYGYNIKQDARFRHSRDVISAMMKELKSLGKGNKPYAAQPFADDELRVFVNIDLLGTSKMCL